METPKYAPPVPCAKFRTPPRAQQHAKVVSANDECEDQELQNNSQDPKHEDEESGSQSSRGRRTRKESARRRVVNMNRERIPVQEADRDQDDDPLFSACGTDKMAARERSDQLLSSDSRRNLYEHKDSPFSPLAIGVKKTYQLANDHFSFLGEVYKLRRRARNLARVDAMDANAIWNLHRAIQDATPENSCSSQGSTTSISGRTKSQIEMTPKLLEAMERFTSLSRDDDHETSRVNPTALGQGDIVLKRTGPHSIELLKIRSGEPTANRILPVLQLHLGPYSVKHVSNVPKGKTKAVRLSMEFLFDEKADPKHVERRRLRSEARRKRKIQVERDRSASTNSPETELSQDAIHSRTARTRGGRSRSSSGDIDSASGNDEINSSNGCSDAGASRSQQGSPAYSTSSEILDKDNAAPSGVRFTAVFPDHSNTVEARVATLPQVSTVVIVLSVVVWLCLKHMLLGLIFLTITVKLFMDFLKESPFSPYTGTVEFEVALSDITGVQYNHRLTEDGHFALEVRKCKITHFRSQVQIEEKLAEMVKRASMERSTSVQDAGGLSKEYHGVDTPRVMHSIAVEGIRGRQPTSTTRRRKRSLSYGASKKSESLIREPMVRSYSNVNPRKDSEERQLSIEKSSLSQSSGNVHDLFLSARSLASPADSSRFDHKPSNQLRRRKNAKGSTPTMGPKNPETLGDSTSQRKKERNRYAVSSESPTSPVSSTDPSNAPDASTQWEKVTYIKRTTMIRVYFNEPLIHPVVSSFVQLHEELTHLSEDGLPSWAIFLASYGLPYYKWMRTAMDIGLWVASIVMMLVAMYDLFQNVAAVRWVFGWIFGSWFEWFEKAIVLRLTAFVTVILPQLQIFNGIYFAGKRLCSGLRTCCVTVGTCLRPVVACGRTICGGLTVIGRYLCCCCRGTRTAVEAAAKVAPAGSSWFMRGYRLANWMITLFRRLVLGGIARISSWILSHWASLYRDHISKQSSLLAVCAVLFVLLSIFWG